MAITTDKVLRMTFSTVGGGSSNLTLPAPREDLTAEEIRDAMQLIIDKNIFLASGGELIGIKGIKIIETTVNDLSDSI
ncbi:MAG: DUF2922 domain-containing protein [Desulfitobacteriia bacterium]|jgi:hypothetical protein